jgi:hypothetical protein
MMKERITKIGFALSKITTEQFAIIEEIVAEKGNVTVVTNLRFGVDDKKRMIACFAAFTFEIDLKPFIIIETGCHFQILAEAWFQMKDEEKNTLNVPQGFLSHLAVITVGTARGVLHSKTENTCYNKYVLPTINVAELIKDDAVFSFNSQL